MSKSRWILLTAPFLLTLVLAFGLAATPHGDRSLVVKIELDTAVLLAGLFLSLNLGLIFWLKTAFSVRAARLASRIQQETDETRRRFLRRLDHELKNPLTAIRAALANLDPVADDAQAIRARESVESQVLRLSQLTSDLRKLAELESRPLEEQNPVETGALIREVFETIQDRTDPGMRAFALSLPQAPWPLSPVRGDRDLLYLALYNLLDNAVKFSAQGDTVELRAFEDGPNVVIEVADTGRGIADHEAPFVWQDLYRGKDAHGIPGSGLGLPMVRAIAQLHGGTCSLRSKPAHGTVISLRLPAIRSIPNL